MLGARPTAGAPFPPLGVLHSGWKAESAGRFAPGRPQALGARCPAAQTPCQSPASPPWESARGPISASCDVELVLRGRKPSSFSWQRPLEGPPDVNSFPSLRPGSGGLPRTWPRLSPAAAIAPEGLHRPHARQSFTSLLGCGTDWLTGTSGSFNPRQKTEREGKPFKKINVLFAGHFAEENAVYILRSFLFWEPLSERTPMCQFIMHLKKKPLYNSPKYA